MYCEPIFGFDVGIYNINKSVTPEWTKMTFLGISGVKIVYTVHLYSFKLIHVASCWMGVLLGLSCLIESSVLNLGLL